MHKKYLLAVCLTAIAMSAQAQEAAAPTGTLKKTVSVDLFQGSEATGGSTTAEGMTSLLVDALMKDGRFVVVERPQLGNVQTEQALGAHGATTPETSAKSKQLIGAGTLIHGAITKYEAAANGGGIQLAGLPLGNMLGGNAGVNLQQAKMEISLRLIDTTTGQVVETVTADGSANGENVRAGATTALGGDLSASAFHHSPIGEAGEQAINDAVNKIADAMGHVAWSALVADAGGGKIYVNAGADRNVQPGLVLNIYRKGGVLTDPGTGETLDVEMNRIGQLRIESVQQKYSTATLVGGGEPQRGDLLKTE